MSDLSAAIGTFASISAVVVGAAWSIAGRLASLETKIDLLFGALADRVARLEAPPIPRIRQKSNKSNPL